ncbi:MAG: DUF2272 domain-containing protein [Rhodospirillales bacterium]|nr:DUF2272 domain-containing protein [Rhodospirillales bacterium]
MAEAKAGHHGIGAAMLLLAALLAGCTAPDAHVPPFARVPYQAFSRQAVIAIALREWRVFGEPVDDGAITAPQPAQKPERAQGLWQRVGEYWWLGLNAGDPDNALTGKHDAAGHVFPASRDGDYAWSAAFISYVMRIAGAGAGFPYAADHAHYIDLAARMAAGTAHGWDIVAMNPATYAPRPGDLVCNGRDQAAGLRFADLPAGHFPAHCGIVVAAADDPAPPAPPQPGTVEVIGGNVGDAVSLTHAPVDRLGMLDSPAGRSLDPRTRWLAVLRVLYPNE